MTTTISSTTAWLLRGTGNVPGKLKCIDGNISFVAHGFGTLWKRQLRKLEQDVDKPGLAELMDKGKAVPVFSVPLDSVKVVFPWYYFSGGMKLIFNNKQFKISFVRPNKDVSTESGVNVSDLSSGRKTGKAWKKALTAQKSDNT